MFNFKNYLTSILIDASLNKYNLNTSWYRIDVNTYETIWARVDISIYETNWTREGFLRIGDYYIETEVRA